jgi:hypothetical protein
MSGMPPDCILIVCLYIDDALIAYSSKGALQALHDALTNSGYELKTEDPAEGYFGATRAQSGFRKKHTYARWRKSLGSLSHDNSTPPWKRAWRFDQRKKERRSQTPSPIRVYWEAYFGLHPTLDRTSVTPSVFWDNSFRNQLYSTSARL